MWKPIAVAVVALIVPGLAPAGAQTADINACVASERQPQAAIAACTRILSRPNLNATDRVRALGYRGNAYRVTGDMDRALADAEAALRVNRTYSYVWNLRALVLTARKDFDRALADLDEAIRLAPKDAASYHNRGLIWNEKGEYDKAIAEFNRALSVNPKLNVTFLERGISHYKKKSYDQALTDMNEAVARNPSSATAHGWRGSVHFDTRRYNEAIQDFDQAVRLDPRIAWLYNLRGASNRELGRNQEAIRDHDEAIRLDPLLAAAYVNRGVIYRRLNDYARAIRDYDDAIRLKPGEPLAYFHRAVVHRLNGNLSQAYRDIVQAIALNPSHQEATTERETIRGLMAAAPVAPAVTPAPAPAPPPVASQQQRGPRVALVIGNGRYRTAPELANPVNDARDLATALRDLGFRVIEGYDLDGAGMRAKIGEFGAAMSGAATTLFFYAGHGVQVGGQNYLIPVDAKLERPSALDVETLRVSTVLADMEAEKRVNLVFLDACRDNPLSRSLARAFGGTRSAAVGQGLAQVNAGIGTLITFATSPDRVALDGTGRNSPFTAALLRHIRTPDLEVRTLLTRVRSDVIRDTNERQIPWDHSSLTGEFYFKRGGS